MRRLSLRAFLSAQIRKIRMTDHSGARGLIAAEVLLVLATVCHGMDHTFRQERGLRAAGVGPIALGGLVWLYAFAGLYLALMGHRHAVLAGFAVGLTAALITAVTHLPPDWGVLSDLYPELGLDTASWIAMSSVIVTGSIVALTAAATGWRDGRKAVKDAPDQADAVGP